MQRGGTPASKLKAADCLHRQLGIYSRRLIQQAIWYKPDGTVIATENFDKKSGGKGYYLRQDGTIKSQVAYRFDPETNSYVGVGKVLYYDRNGSPNPNLAKAID